MIRTFMVSSFVSLFLCVVASTCVRASDELAPDPAIRTQHEISTIQPNYVASDQLLELLGVEWVGQKGMMEWSTGVDRRSVELRSHDTANLLILAGDPEDVRYVTELIRILDVPPRQIEVEAIVIEVNESKVLDAGIDWHELLEGSSPRVSYSGDRTSTERETTRTDDDKTTSKTVDSRGFWRFDSLVRLDDVIRILDETGAGNVRVAPRILTLNNRTATILDGERVTYVTRYSAHTNLYETEVMDAGLTLKVRPSLGGSGLLTLDIHAEMTQLGGSISGSPVKSGQIVENTVVAQDGQTILLGGFSRTVESSTKRRFPVLGHILPFLFSREIRSKETVQSYITLTARVVDLESNLDPVKSLDGE